MNTILMAMTRDLIYRCRWSLFAFAWIANLLPLMLFAALRSEGIDGDDPHLRLLLFRLMSLNAIFCAASLIDSYPFLARLLVAPVSSAKLFFFMLIPQMLLAATATLLIIAFQNWVTSQAYPAWSAALISSCGVAICWSTHWMTYKSAWQPIAFAITLGGFLAWYFARFSWLEQPEPLVDLSSFERVSICITTILVSWIGCHGFARFRCGEGLGSRAAPFFSSHPTPSRAKPANRFSTPFAAQLWFEWHSRGWILPLFVGIGILVGIVTWTIRSRDPQMLFQGLVDSGYLLSCLGAVLGICALGNYGFSWATGNQKPDFELGHFLSSRPLTNTMLAYANLLTLGKSVLIAWGIWGLSIIISYSYVLNAHLSDALTSAWWYFPTTLILLWTATTVLTSITLTGKRQTFTLGVPAIGIGGSIAIMAANRFLDPATKTFFWHLSQIAFAIGTCAGSAWLFKKAYDRQFVSKSVVVCCGVIWLLLTAAIAIEAYRNEHRTISIYLATIGIAALTVASFAASPLAIARNRTR